MGKGPGRDAESAGPFSVSKGVAMASPTMRDVHVPTTGDDEDMGKKSFVPPQSVRSAAKRGLDMRRKWKRGGLDTREAGRQGIGSGVARASNLANGDAVSLATVKMMARFFARHQKNNRPGKKESDGGPTAGTIAWLLWGGDAGQTWANKIIRQEETMDKLFKVNGDEVRLVDLVGAWLTKAERFTSTPWSDPQSNLSPQDYARVSLIDLNEPGADKVKSKIKLPIRSRPGGPINVNALKAVASVLAGGRGGVDAPDEAKRKAARTTVRLLRQAGVTVSSEPLLRLAGQTQKQMQVEIIYKADEKQVAYGVILRPNVPDGDGDLYDEEAVQEAAWKYMATTGGTADWLHQAELDKEQAVMVESFISPTDFDWGGFQVKKGDWVGGMWVRDKKMWQAVKKGEISAFSIKGVGRRTPLT